MASGEVALPVSPSCVDLNGAISRSTVALDLCVRGVKWGRQIDDRLWGLKYP